MIENSETENMKFSSILLSEKLHRLEMQTKGKFFRVGGPIVAGMVAVPVGSLIGYGIAGCGLMSGCFGHSTTGGVAAVGISAARIAGAYLAGNHADRRWTTVEILP
jgi:hypothetical protein